MPDEPFGGGGFGGAFGPLEDLVGRLVAGLEQGLGREAPSGGPGGGPGARPRARTPRLDRYGRGLTAAAREGRLDPVVGRSEEVDAVLEVLARRTKNNPVLLGDPGVGKTAIVEGIAARIVAGEVPEALRDVRVVALDLAGMVAGTKYRGEVEQRLTGIVDEVVAAQRSVVLFVDELHAVVGAGAAEGGAMDAGTILKPALARGELQLIGATTLRDYRRHIEKDPALERRVPPGGGGGAGAGRAVGEPRGLPPPHREGPGAGAAVRAGAGGRADGGADRGDPAGAAGALRAPPPGAYPGRRAGGGGDAVGPVRAGPVPAGQGDRPGGPGGVAAAAAHAHPGGGACGAVRAAVAGPGRGGGGGGRRAGPGAEPGGWGRGGGGGPRGPRGGPGR